MNNKTRLSLYHALSSAFPYVPTADQSELMKQLSYFLLRADPGRIFVLKGYAGTGKTTMISTLVRALKPLGFNTELLAPTGRAAKVMGLYAGKTAFTIHKKIYYSGRNADGGMTFSLRSNKSRKTLFIVDEASMIPDGSSNSNFFEKRSLLSDLLSFVKSGKECLLMLVGDTAQLPPVHLLISPALDVDKWKYDFGMESISHELKEVMRQHKNSGILANATHLRALINNGKIGEFNFDLNFDDVIRLTDGYDIQDAIYANFSENPDQSVLVVRSNKRANLFNRQIRHHMLGLDGELCVGDHLMIVKNNYYWLDDSDEVGFIANGDIGEVLEIFSFKSLYGFRFAEVKLRLIDYPNQPPFESILLLDTLDAETPALSYEQANQLYQEVSADYLDEKSKYKRMIKVKNNPYFNALQVKFSYALTCHKTQGGQWSSVFVEQPYLPDGEDISYLRWLYTAMTRARDKLFLIGFNDDYFE